MPRNGSGTYTLPAGNPVVTGTVISSTVHNNTMSDIADELTNSVDKDGQTVYTGNQDYNGNALILDVDADSKIEVTVDDRFDLTLGGVLSLSTTSAQTLLLDAIAKLTPTDSNFIVGNGTTFVAESGSTARTSLGVNLTTKGSMLAGDGTAPAVVPVGANGTILSANSAVSAGVEFATLASLYNPDFEEFTSSGSYAIPVSATYVYVEAIGGGGGGGSSAGSTAGGGGGGGFNFGTFRAADLTGPVTITIGAAGTAGTAGGAGGDGGNTTFGTYLSALGGKGGGGTATAAPGGASGDYVNAVDVSAWSSGAGGSGSASTTGFAGGSCIKGGAGGGGGGVSAAGAGGTSTQGGNGGAGGTVSGTAGTQPGGGGGGGGNGNGAVGGAGRVRVWSW